MATPPDFSPGQVLTAAHMDAVGSFRTGGATFTGQTAVNIANCFPTDYDKFQVTYNIRSASGSASLYLRLSVGGAPNITASSYVSGGRYVGFPGVGAADFNGAGTEWGFSFYTTFSNNGTITVTDVNVASATAMSCYEMSQNASAFLGGYHNQSVAYDGLYITNSTASAMYGSITICGIRN